MEEERLSPGALLDLLHRLRAGDATKPEARSILAEFVALVSGRKLVPPELLAYLGEAFAGYLHGSHGTLEQAFSLTRKKAGNPGADAEKRLKIAAHILASRLHNKNLSHEGALYAAAREYRCGTTKAGDAWRNHRLEAFERLRFAWALAGKSFTRDEWARACRLARVSGKRRFKTRRKA